MRHFKKRPHLRKPAYRKRRAVGSRKGSVSASVKKYVKRQLHTSIENKCFQVNGGVAFGNVNESPDFNAYPMCPLATFWTIPQGVGQGARVGNIIKTRKVYLSYVLRPNAYNATTNVAPQPVEVQLLLGYVKNTPCFSPVSGDVAQLFNAGSSVLAPVGTLRDIISVVNNDYWVIKKRWNHKLGFANNQGTGSFAGTQYGANNDFKMNVVKRMDITKMVPATHQFNDANSTTNTKNLFLMYYCVASSGGTFDALTQPATMEFWVDFIYEDA